MKFMLKKYNESDFIQKQQLNNKLPNMGCSSPQNAAIPNIPQVHLNRLQQIAQISHPLNVNKKYEHLARIDTTKEVGAGYRKVFGYKYRGQTYIYYALTNKQDLEAKRKQFWQTRTSGQPAVWQTIRDVISVKDSKNSFIEGEFGEEILKTNRIYMLNGTVQMCLDSKHNKYEVPVFCINQPASYTAHRQDQNLVLEYQNKTFQITIRSAKYPNGDIKLSEQNSTQVGLIKQTLRAMKSLGTQVRIRFFYTGREMKDDKTIGNYGYVPGTVIQAMIL